MSDKSTGGRLVVLVSEKYGPFFRIYEEKEPEWLARILEGKFYLPYWVVKTSDLDGDGVLEYYFGRAADPEKLQEILDTIQPVAFKS